MSTDSFAWDDLRLVLAVAEARGLAPAAERLHLNGSTVFRRLAQLEARLGLKLFERHRGGYVPTAAGDEMLAFALQMEEGVASLSLKLAGQAPSPEGEIRVTTSDALLVHLLTPILAAFRQAHPGVRLDVVVANEALNLARRDADVAIRATDEPPESLVGRRLASVAWAIYGVRSENGPEPLDNLAVRDWVLPGEGLDAIPAARRIRSQVPPTRIVYRLNSVMGLTEAIEAGIGIGPLPCFLADRRPRLVQLTPPDPAASTALWILTHPHLRHAPRVRSFVDFVVREITARRGVLAGEKPEL